MGKTFFWFLFDKFHLVSPCYVPEAAVGLITVVEASKHAAGDAADVPPAAPWRMG